MKKIPYKLYESALIWSESMEGISQILRNILISVGMQPHDIVEYSQDGKVRLLTYHKTKPEALTLQNHLKRLGLKKVKFEITVLERPQWQEKWKRDFSPFPLTRTLDVVPVWRIKDYRKKAHRTPILIDTITAFGTGLHDTTRFMSQLIESQKGNFNDFLDVGTGTGLLCLVALHCGAKEIHAIDIDPECITVAKKNLTRNGRRFDSIVASDLKTFDPQRTFDFVAANLITADLIKLKKVLLSLIKKDGHLAVSGISLENLASLNKAFTSLPLRKKKILKSRNWAALLYQKK